MDTRIKFCNGAKSARPFPPPLPFSSPSFFSSLPSCLPRSGPLNPTRGPRSAVGLKLQQQMHFGIFWARETMSGGKNFGSFCDVIKVDLDCTFWRGKCPQAPSLIPLLSLSAGANVRLKSSVCRAFALVYTCGVSVVHSYFEFCLNNKLFCIVYAIKYLRPHFLIQL